MRTTLCNTIEPSGEDYDEVVPFFTEYGAAIMAVLDPPPGSRFLDVGAGRGALTARLSSEAA